MKLTLNELINKNEDAFYLFDSAVLRERVKYIKSFFDNNVNICYAVKANTFITGEIADSADRFEICSPGEERICRDIGIEYNKMVISGVYKTPSFIENLIADESFDGIITAESVHQYDFICEYAQKYAHKIKVLPRLTNDSQFGVNKSDIEKMISERENHPYIDIAGIQFFSGTQKTSVKKYAREINKLNEFLNHLRDDYGYTARELEYGTGFPVAYFEGEETNEEEIFTSLSSILSSIDIKPEITLEIGRSIAASCGKYYTHIVDIKTNKSQNYVLTDGGMHHIVYFGQHMAMKMPAFSVVNKENEPKEKEYNICGSLCSMNDIMVKQAPLPEIKIGDVICFENTGAYCPTEGISLFLSRDIPAVYLKKEDSEIVRLRDSFETYSLNNPKDERMF